MNKVKKRRTKYELAKLVRKHAEIYAEQLIPYSDSATLSCLCAICSYTLTKLFNNHKYKARMIKGTFHDNRWGDSPHCWTESDGQIWDLTATQFDGVSRKILVVDAKNKRFKKKDSIRLDLVHHVLQEWPVEQKPQPHVVRLLLEKNK